MLDFLARQTSPENNYLPQALASLAAPSSQPAGPSNAHVIAVLGVPTLADGLLSPGLARRVNTAVQLAARYPQALLVASGAAVANAHTEAWAIGAALVAQGVAPERVWIEPHALSTFGNVAYIGSMLGKCELVAWHSPQRLTIVAEPHQAVRALRLFVGLTAKLTTRPKLVLCATERGDCDYPTSPKLWRLADRLGLDLQAMPQLERCIEEQYKLRIGW